MKRLTATHRIFILLCSLSFLLYVDRVNLSTAAGPIQADLGLSNLQLGVAFSAFAYSYLICQIFGGVIADKFGPRITLIGCVAIWVISTVATGLIGGLASLFAARLVLGIGEGATLPAQARAIANWTPADRRGIMQGITHSFSRLGNAVTPPFVALLITLTSWRMSFFILAGLTAVWLVFWMLFFRDNPRDDPRITPAEMDRLPDRGLIAATRPPAIPWKALFARVGPTAAVYFCYGWTGWLYFTWLPIFFLHGYNLNIRSSALFSSGVFFAGVVGDGMGGFVSDMILRRTGRLFLARSVLIALVFLASAACLTPVLIGTDLLTITLSLSAAFFFIEMSIAPIWAVAIDIAPVYAATSSAIINAGSAVAGILSPMLFGLIIDRTGNWSAPFIGSVGLLILGAFIALFIRPEIKLGAPSSRSRPLSPIETPT
jgi:MFS family permease